MTNDGDLEKLEEALDAAKEQLYLAQSDLKYARSENIALTDFLRVLYANCRELKENDEIDGKKVIENLAENIRVFAKDHRIDL